MIITFLANEVVLWVFVILLAGIALLLMWNSWRSVKRRRLVDNIPTSKTTGVYIGMVELKGQAMIQAIEKSYLALIDCVYYQWTVKEKWKKTTTETYTDSDGKRKTRTKTKTGWKQVASGGASPNFYLADEEGHLLIDPQGAEIQATEVFDRKVKRRDPLYYEKGPQSSIAHSVHERHFEEHAIAYKQDIYVMGQSKLRDDIIAPMIAEYKEAPMYLISVKSEEQISSGMKWTSIGCALLACLLPLASVALGIRAAALSHGDLWWIYMIVFLAFTLLWFLGWLWVVYNSMIDLKNRLEAAKSNVDVQLKRRHDLIPQIVNVVQGYVKHEKDLQESIATLRTQAQATMPGESGPAPVGVQGHVFALQEAYPELKAQEQFSKLQEQLVDCENRISLARGFYNEFASHLNTRIEVIPDSFISGMAGLQKQDYIGSEGFERAVPEIHLQSEA